MRGKIYKKVEDILTGITLNWQKLSLDEQFLQRLTGSMARRIAAVRIEIGGPTRYWEINRTFVQLKLIFSRFYFYVNQKAKLWQNFWHIVYSASKWSYYSLIFRPCNARNSNIADATQGGFPHSRMGMCNDTSLLFLSHLITSRAALAADYEIKCDMSFHIENRVLNDDYRFHRLFHELLTGTQYSRTQKSLFRITQKNGIFRVKSTRIRDQHISPSPTIYNLCGSAYNKLG